MTSRKTEIARSRGEFPENKRNEHDEERAVNWDEKVNAAGIARGLGALAVGVVEAKRRLREARWWAKWQRNQLRTDEAAERVGRALNREGWTCYEGTHEPGQYDTCTDCKRVCDDHARAAITALLGEET